MVSQQNPNACQMHEADVVFNLILIAHCNPAIAQQPAVQAFNLPSPLVSPQRPTILRFRSGAVATMWSDYLDATLSQCSIQSHTPCRQSSVWVHPPQNKRGLNKLGFIALDTRADQPSNKHSAKLTPDLSVQKLTCVHRAHISGE